MDPGEQEEGVTDDGIEYVKRAPTEDEIKMFKWEHEQNEKKKKEKYAKKANFTLDYHDWIDSEKDI